MTITLKFVVSCDILGWRKKFRVVILAMHSLRPISMLQLMTKIVRVWNMCLSKLPNLTFRNA
jgi:hypothetical protein